MNQIPDTPTINAPPDSEYFEALGQVLTGLSYALLAYRSFREATAPAKPCIADLERIYNEAGDLIDVVLKDIYPEVPLAINRKPSGFSQA